MVIAPWPQRSFSARLGLVAPAAWLTGSSSNPLALFPVFVISVVAMSVLLTILTTITVRPPRYA
jgi:hypothetical protein